MANVQVDGVNFKPSSLKRVEDSDQLTLDATKATASLSPGEPYTAKVQLKDDRTLEAPVIVELPRPQITLLNKGVQADGTNPLPPVQLGSPDDLPVDARLVFFLKSNVPAAFPRDEKVEVAAADTSFHTLLSLNDGSLMLEDAGTAMGSVEPRTRFGSSAFGPVRVRAIAADGEAGDWLPLGTLVRLPGFEDLRCPRALAKPCLLEASNLFLATSFSATPDFGNATEVAPEFTGTQMIVPHPVNGVLYLKLRDDPGTVQTLALPVTPIVLPAATSQLYLPLPPTTEQSAAPAKEDASGQPSVDQAVSSYKSEDATSSNPALAGKNSSGDSAMGRGKIPAPAPHAREDMGASAATAMPATK